MKRPVTFIIAAALILVMILLSAVLPMVGGNRLAGGGFPRAGFAVGAGRFGSPQSGNTQNGTTPNQNFVPQSGQTPQGQTSSNGNTQFRPGTRGNFNGNRTTPLLRILQYALYAAELILGLLAIVGLWLSKRWGVVMAIITSVVVLAATIPGMFRVFSTFILVENLLKVILAIAIIVLVVLPKPKPVQIPVQ